MVESVSSTGAVSDVSFSREGAATFPVDVVASADAVLRCLRAVSGDSLRPCFWCDILRLRTMGQLTLGRSSMVEIPVELRKLDVMLGESCVGGGGGAEGAFIIEGAEK
jgi:hypothetical protein